MSFIIGTCSACGEKAERAYREPPGAWWHVGYPCMKPNATFVPPESMRPKDNA